MIFSPNISKLHLSHQPDPFYLLVMSLSQRLLFWFLSSTKMVLRKSLTWVPIFMVIVIVASMPFVQSSRTREFSSLSLSIEVFHFFLMHFYHSICVGLQGRTKMAENTAAMAKVCIVDHKRHVKEKGKIPFLRSYFSNVYPFHVLIDLFVFSTKMVFFFSKKKLFIYLFCLFGKGISNPGCDIWKWRSFCSHCRRLSKGSSSWT